MNFIYAGGTLLVFMIISCKWLRAEIRLRKSAWYYYKALHLFKTANKRKVQYRRCLEDLRVEFVKLREQLPQKYVPSTDNCTECTALEYEYTDGQFKN